MIIRWKAGIVVPVCFWILLLTTIWGCVDDIESRYNQDGNVMSFNVEIKDEWTTHDSIGNTRSVIADEPFSLQLEEGSSGSYFLHVSSYGHINEKNTSYYRDAVTRGTSINNLNEYATTNGYSQNYDDAFGLIAYAYSGTWSAASPKIFDHQKVSKTGSIYTTANKYYWPNSSFKMRLYAYAPYGNNNLSLAYNGSGEPTLNYTVPANVTEQPDVVTLSTDINSSDFASPYSLTFNHALTAVVFAVGDLVNCTIKSIQLKNVYDTGVYNFVNDTWSASNKNDFTISQSQLGFATDGVTQTTSQNVAITSGSKTLMMVPQTLPSDAQLIVTLSTTNIITGIASEHVLTANIGNGTWVKGRTVIYKISSSSINTELTVFPPTSYSYAGGDHKFTIYSYTYKGNGIATVKPYKITLSTDGGQTWGNSYPSYFKLKNSSGTQVSLGSDINTNIIDGIATCNAQSGSTSSHATVLENAGSVAGIYDLSTHDQYGNTSLMNTANCYVIKKKGTYKLPLVYGNAIKNGVANTSAYTSTASGTYVLNNFVNHLDNAITSPYIYENSGCTPTGAKLLWTDYYSGGTVITDVKLTDDNKYLQFTMGKTKLACCNTVIAVLGKDAGGNTVPMWSWHIWVTDENMYSPVTVVNHDKVSYQVMPQVLGWCSTKTQSITYYPSRYVIVRVTQDEDHVADFAIDQNEYYDYGVAVADIGYHPFYQWGRKDPFLPAVDNQGENTLRPLYDSAGNKAASDFKLAKGGITIGKAIQEPDMFHSPSRTSTSDGDWSSTYYCNMWCSNLETVGIYDYRSVVKTIYDPSPVGYHVPSALTFTGFSTTGGYVAAATDANKNWTYVNCTTKTGEEQGTYNTLAEWKEACWNNGLTFYCNPYNKANSNHIYFPCDGELYTQLEPSDTYPNAGNLSGAGVWCHIWCAFGSAVHRGAHVAANASGNLQISPTSGYFPSYGWSVRPVMDAE